MKDVCCPLCHSQHLDLLESVSTCWLARYYRLFFGVSIAPEFWPATKIKYLNCRHCDLHFFSPSCAGDERFYAQLQANDWYYEKEKDEFRIAAQLIGKSSDVLDIGAGSGVFQDFLPDSRYVGLDLSPNAARIAAQHGRNVQVGTIQEFATTHVAAFDVVCAFQTLEHIEDICSFLEAALSCLKPGGTLLVSVPAHDSYMRNFVNCILDMPPHHVSHWSDASLRNLGKEFQLELQELLSPPVEVRHYPDAVYAAVCTRIYGRNSPVMVSGLGVLRWLLIKLIAKLVTRFGAYSVIKARGHTVIARYVKR